MFFHLKPWKSWQVIAFHSYEYQEIQTKNPFDGIENFKF
jgi:hypothetical protein